MKCNFSHCCCCQDVKLCFLNTKLSAVEGCRNLRVPESFFYPSQWEKSIKAEVRGSNRGQMGKLSVIRWESYLSSTFQPILSFETPMIYL